jgi:hypothetical protein
MPSGFGHREGAAQHQSDSNGNTRAAAQDADLVTGFFVQHRPIESSNDG